MKKIYRTITLIALMGLTFSCQKEQEGIMENAISQTNSRHTVVYWVDGEMRLSEMNTDEDWECLLHQFFIWAKEGYQVSFRNADAADQVISIKEKVTYTTKDMNDAEKWAREKEKAGYDVSISYDQTTGVYTCTAIR